MKPSNIFMELIDDAKIFLPFMSFIDEENEEDTENEI